MQVAVLRFAQAKLDNPSKFSASEIALIEKLHRDWDDGKYSTWSSLLEWASSAEKYCCLRLTKRGRASGFHAGEVFREHFDSVALSGYRYGLKPFTGGQTVSSLKKGLGTETNPKTLEAPTVLL